MLVIFEQIVWSKLYQILRFFDQKWLTILDKVMTSFWKTFCDQNNCSMLNYLLLTIIILHLPKTILHLPKTMLLLLLI